MTDKKRVLLLVTIMTMVASIIVMAAVGILYETAFAEKRKSLEHLAQSRARLMEAMARHELTHGPIPPGERASGMLSQIIDAHGEYDGLGETGEFTLARLEDDQIKFLLRHRHYDLDNPKPVPFKSKSKWAEPMRRALMGQSGTVVALDYRGVEVVAAYEPVAVLGLGIVAKIDLAEVRAPFFNAGGIVIAVSLLVDGIGALLFFWISNPMINEIRRSEARFRDAIDGLADGFAYFDSDDRLVAFNKNFYDTRPGNEQSIRVGMTFEDFLRIPVEDTLLNSGFVQDEPWVQRRVKEHLNPSGPHFRKLEDGRFVQINEYKTNEGGIVFLRIDITELKKIEAKLNVAVEEAVLSSRTKTEFLANMSHELRTPLNAIIGFSEILKDGMSGALADEKQQEYAEDINRSGEHLLELINDILDVSVIEAGKLELREEQVEVAPLVGGVLRLIRPRAEVEKVKLSVETDENLYAVRADERRLKQILLNLLSNAVKFTPEGGRVTLRANLEKDGGVSFSVTDTGIGMETKDLEIALRQFGQVDSSMERKYEGTGLGLPLAKRLVEAHGGTLEINSIKGTGTTVIACFPAERVISKTQG